MSKEREIICIINDSLDAGLSNTIFKSKVFNGIAIDRQRSNEDSTTELIEMQSGKTEKKIFPNDANSIMCYHKYSGSNYKESRGYGRDNFTYDQEAQMTLIVVANRNIIKDLMDDTLEQLIIENMRPNITKTQLTELVLQAASIKISSSNIDAGILVREFPEIKRNTYPNIICFEVKYSINTKYAAACADGCLTI
jgi:hypothetical protein